ncbi:TPA: MxiN [Escherichia coli]|uniref:MxiN n=1 Tax=Escherichia coli TaxID=562 RepID=UPI000E2DEC60|nr:MxiN [Escherichia coli]RDQ03934.1 Oxygen-regulated invasion protein OrgB [Escherichia coli]RDQ54382.1 Oxygen-regulated invasion protein OrgB [Escherichia coli]
MQENTLPVSTANAYNGIVIKKKEKDLCKTIRNREIESRKKAKEILLEATRKGEASRVDAIRQGYQDGMQCAFKHVINFLSEWKLKLDNNRREVDNYIQSILGDNLHNEEIVNNLLNGWIESLNESVSELVVVLPVRSRDWAKKIECQKFELSPHMNITYRYVESENYIFSYGENVVEFSPEDIISQAKSEFAEKLTKQDKLFFNKTYNEIIKKFANDLLSESGEYDRASTDT